MATVGADRKTYKYDWWSKSVQPGCPSYVPVTKYNTHIERHYKAIDPVRPEHRVKPASLLESMTSRGPFYRSTNVYRLETRNTVVSAGCTTAPPCPRYLEERFWISGHPDIYGLSLAFDIAPSNSVDMRLKIKEASYNMADTIGEYRETVDLFGSSVKHVVREAENAYDRLPRVFRRKVKMLSTPVGLLFRGIRGESALMKKKWVVADIPSTYLGASFALAPTLSTVHDAMVAVGRHANGPIKKRFVCRSSATNTDTIPGIYKGEALREIYHSRRLICYVSYDPASLTDWTAGNPAEALWAALPFSWLVDYFVNVGDYLSSLDAMKGILSIRAVETHRVHAFQLDSRVNTSSKSSVTKAGAWTIDAYKRTVSNSLPLPTLPVWKPSVSWRKLTYPVAILASLKLRS
jgi:hypothetical protein